MPNHERDAATSINRSWPVLERYFDSPAWRASGTDPASIMRGMPWAAWTEQVGRVTAPLAAATAAAFGEEAQTIGKVSGILGFKIVDDVSVKYAQTQGSKLIASITESQRATVRTMVGESLRGDWTADQLGRRLRDTVGLHPAWATAVTRYEEKQNARLIREGKTPEEAAEIAAKRAAKKHKHLLKVRAENIARTEIQTASNLGKYATWDSAIGKGFASKDSTKEFSPGPGACEICAPITGEVVGWDQPFSNGKMMPPFHPGCRCTANLLPPDYNDAELDPQAFDWLSREEATDRPDFIPTLQNRIGNLSNRPAPFIPPPAAAAATAAPLAAPSTVAASKADELTLASTAHLSDDQLNDLLVQLSADDPDAVDKILEIFDQRDAAAAAAKAFDMAEEAREAEAKVMGWGEVPDEYLKPVAGSLSRSPARGLTPDEQVKEDYYAYIQSQHAKALNDLNGNFFKNEFRGKGLDEFAILFEGNTVSARKYASEELIAWWEENGRHTLGSFRYGALGKAEDYKRHQRVLREGFGGKLGGTRDRSQL